ncbi:WGxxGxxG family protein [Pantanalinema rosaneae CENA516]|uniref:WGxxGxxG family protein n=1 Tax=Pantanalinema rosaneae TaxID=1620701 RepID=UPI003D6F5F28
MRLTAFSKLAGATVLTLGLTTLPLIMPASAQDTPAGTTTGQTTDTTTDQAGDRDFDWGWLGLLGLIGLAGLARKNDEPTVQYRDRDEVSSTRARY